MPIDDVRSLNFSRLAGVLAGVPCSVATFATSSTGLLRKSCPSRSDSEDFPPPSKYCRGVGRQPYLLVQINNLERLENWNVQASGDLYPISRVPWLVYGPCYCVFGAVQCSRVWHWALRMLFPSFRFWRLQFCKYVRVSSATRIRNVLWLLMAFVLFPRVPK